MDIEWNNEWTLRLEISPEHFGGLKRVIEEGGDSVVITCTLRATGPAASPSVRINQTIDAGETTYHEPSPGILEAPEPISHGECKIIATVCDQCNKLHCARWQPGGCDGDPDETGDGFCHGHKPEHDCGKVRCAAKRCYFPGECGDRFRQCHHYCTNDTESEQ